MKPFIAGTAALLLSIVFYSFLHDFNLNRQALEELKVVCEEASAAGSLFIDDEEYAEGKIVFNQIESVKAIEAVIIASLELDSNMDPSVATYWQKKITYKAYFIDDRATDYPYLYIDSDTGYTTLIKAPTVVVTINGGKGRYALPLLKNGSDNIRSGAHTWEDR